MHAIVLLFLFSFLIGTEAVMYFCFLPSTETALQTLPPTLWLSNGSHNQKQRKTPQEFLLVFCVLDYRYLIQILHGIFLCLCDRVFVSCMIFFSIVVSDCISYFFSQLFMLCTLLDLHKTSSKSLHCSHDYALT